MLDIGDQESALAGSKQPNNAMCIVMGWPGYAYLAQNGG